MTPLGDWLCWVLFVPGHWTFVVRSHLTLLLGVVGRPVVRCCWTLPCYCRYLIVCYLITRCLCLFYDCCCCSYWPLERWNVALTLPLFRHDIPFFVVCLYDCHCWYTVGTGVTVVWQHSVTDITVRIALFIITLTWLNVVVCCSTLNVDYPRCDTDCLLLNWTPIHPYFPATWLRHLLWTVIWLPWRCLLLTLVLGITVVVTSVVVWWWWWCNSERLTRWLPCLVIDGTHLVTICCLLHLVFGWCERTDVGWVTLGDQATPNTTLGLTVTGGYCPFTVFRCCRYYPAHLPSLLWCQRANALLSTPFG